MSAVAVDTSAAIALLVATHPAHETVAAWARGRSLTLSGHALAETYSVLTRLPGDVRLKAQDAVTLIDANFDDAVTLDPATQGAFHREFASRGIAGAAVYDALVAFAAKQNGLALATRDARARPTYEAIGVHVLLVV